MPQEEQLPPENADAEPNSTKVRVMPQEEQLPPENADAEPNSTKREKRGIFFVLNKPLSIVIITFLLTGLFGTIFSNWVSHFYHNREIERSNLYRKREASLAEQHSALVRRRELELSNQRDAIQSIRNITNLLYQRRIRGVLLSSAIKRGVPLIYVTERKRLYDNVFVIYNSKLQSNLFRVRTIFHTRQYNIFDHIYEKGIQHLFSTQDACLTNAYDDLVVSNADYNRALETLSQCNLGNNTKIKISDLNTILINCIYAYTDALFRVTENPDWLKGKIDLTQNSFDYVSKSCGVASDSP